MSRRARTVSFILGLGASACFSSLARATTEPPTALDARAMAMGSTSVAHVHNGAAVFHNAAALHEVQSLTLTAVLAASRITQTAPLVPNGSSESNPATVPLFLAGGGYRLSPKFVLGLAAFTTGGFGGTYDTPGGDLKAELGAMELSPTLTYSITEKLAVGVGYRVTYAMQKLEQPGIPGMAPGAEIDLSGLNFAGFHAGVYFRPIDSVKLGFAYRSKVTVELDGTTRVAGQEIDTTSEFAFPHAFKLGAAVEVLEDSLVLAAELRYLMHSEANERIVTETDMGDVVQTLDWEDSTGFGVGAEYFVLPILPVRAGYLVTMSATPEERPAPFFPAPGAQQSIHLGAGVRLPNVDLDIGGFYSWGGKDVSDPEPPALPGEYTMNVVAASVSATYHH